MSPKENFVNICFSKKIHFSVCSSHFHFIAAKWGLSSRQTDQHIYHKRSILGVCVSIQYCHEKYRDTMLYRFFSPTPTEKCHAYVFTGGWRGKWEFPIKRWKGKRKVHLIMYPAVCTKNARESAPLFCGEILRLLTAGVNQEAGFLAYASWWNGSSNPSKTKTRRAQRIFATRITLFQLSEHEIIKQLSSHAILQSLEEIKDDIESLTQRSHSIPAAVKLLVTLHILASG